MEIKNEGEDAFKPEIYGDVITIERRISESTSSTVLKDYQGAFVLTIVLNNKYFSFIYFPRYRTFFFMMNTLKIFCL